jgi:hypothetical protein
LNHVRVVEAIGKFVAKKAQYEAVSLDDSDADERVWNGAREVWEEAGGCAITVGILKQLYERAVGDGRPG